VQRFERLPPEKQSEVVKYAALHVARNSKQFELTANGGNYQEYLNLTFALARSGVAEAEDIFAEAASTARDADTDEALRSFFKKCKDAQPHTNGITVATLFYSATRSGADFSPWKRIDSVSLADFYAYMPTHNYIFVPSREMWPASSVNARLGSVPLSNPDGTAAVDTEGKREKLGASTWLDQNQPVEQMTWAPGLPMLIRDRLISEGGWIEQPGMACFNLYLPPTIKPGNAAEAERWLDHIHKVFGQDDAKHIVTFLAHRVCIVMAGASTGPCILRCGAILTFSATDGGGV
jgi:Primase C terminal 2 (PriCT-2)